LEEQEGVEMLLLLMMMMVMMIMGKMSIWKGEE
jgi:hypothetical protein